MSNSNPRLQNAAVVVFWLAVIGGWGYYEFWYKPEKSERKHVEQTAEAKERFQEWAYIAKNKEVAPGETLRLVVIPSPYGIDAFDTKCLIYTNQALQTSSMICPDADRNNLAGDNE